MTLEPSDGQPDGVPNWLFNESSGIHVVGIPGSGKSNFLLYLTKLVASINSNLTNINFSYLLILLDPAGDTAKAARDLCWDLSPAARKRLYYIRPADTDTTVPLNPLRVHHPSHLAAKVSHTNHILLHAWGAADFNQTPRLAKWTTLAVKALALLGLPLVHILDVLDPVSPVHGPIIDAVPDPLVQRELYKLREYSLSEWDDQVGSSYSRWLGFFDNPVVQAILSRSEGLDFRQLMEERAIVLVDLEHGGVLRPEDQQIIANLYLSELLYTVTSISDPAERIPAFLLIDELPVFRSCFDQLERALREIRKYLLRMVCCHQGVYSFPGGPENPLLNNLMSCKTQFFFQLLNQADATFFGKQLSLSDYEPTTVKHVLKQTQFYTAGHDIINLIQEGQSYANTQEESQGDGTSDTVNDSWNRMHGTEENVSATHTAANATGDTTSQEETATKTRGRHDDRSDTRTTNPEAIRSLISVANGRASGLSESEAAAKARGASHSVERSASDATSRGIGISDQSGIGGGTARAVSRQRGRSSATQIARQFTYRQTLFPIIKSREIIASIQFLSPDEHAMLKAQGLARLSPGECLMYVNGRVIVKVSTPLIAKPYERAPLSGTRQRQACLDFLHRRPEYVETKVLTDQRHRFNEFLLFELAKRREEAPVIEAHSPAPLPPPVIDESGDSPVTF